MPEPATTVLTPKDRLSSALAQIPSGLFILTLRHGQRKTGLLLSWVQQCAFDPPRVTFCLKEGRYQLDWLRSGAAAALHVLSEEKGRPLVKRFGAGFSPEEDPFHDLSCLQPEGKAPRLLDALAWLELRPEAFYPVGDHTLIVAEVRAGELQGADSPWLHLRRNGFGY